MAPEIGACQSKQPAEASSENDADNAAEASRAFADTRENAAIASSVGSNPINSVAKVPVLKKRRFLRPNATPTSPVQVAPRFPGSSVTAPKRHRQSTQIPQISA